MKSGLSSFSLLLLAASLSFDSVAAQRRGRNRGGNGNNNNNNNANANANSNSNKNNNAAASSTGANAASGQADGTAQLSTATDGSMIMDTTVNINGLPIRFKVSGPASQFMATTGVPGAAATNATVANTTMGLNVLLHGDGGQSFFDFPNQAVQQNLMGVVALAPNEDLFWGGGSGLDRTDGAAHSAAVNSLIQDVLPQAVAFDKSNVFFTGVSGGSLTLSGFFMPQFMTQYKTGVLLNCGAMPPQVDFVDPAETLAVTRIHYQSTQNELALLQPSIPQAISAVEQTATQAGVSADTIGQLQTVNNSPVGGHCAFDGQGFVSGIQLMADNFANVMQNGTGEVTGIGNVAQTVVGNEKLSFGEPERKKMKARKIKLRMMRREYWG